MRYGAQAYIYTTSNTSNWTTCQGTTRYVTSNYVADCSGYASSWIKNWKSDAEIQAEREARMAAEAAREEELLGAFDEVFA